MRETGGDEGDDALAVVGRVEKKREGDGQETNESESRAFCRGGHPWPPSSFLRAALPTGTPPLAQAHFSMRYQFNRLSARSVRTPADAPHGKPSWSCLVHAAELESTWDCLEGCCKCRI